MSPKSLCRRVRAAVISLAVVGSIVCFYLIPGFGENIARANPEFAYCFWPWLIFLWLTAAPCYAILALAWRVSTAIGNEQVFTAQTARWVAVAARLLFADAGFFFAGNLLLALAVVFFPLPNDTHMSHPAVLVISLLICIIAVSLASIAMVLSRYIAKAAALEEEVLGTI